jgi:hypothetical protein
MNTMIVENNSLLTESFPMSVSLCFHPDVKTMNNEFLRLDSLSARMAFFLNSDTIYYVLKSQH